MSKIKPMHLYLDTSVFGGVYDVEFEVDSKRLIEAIHKRKAMVMVSDVVLQELEDAPDNVKKVLRDLPYEQQIFLSISEEVIKLRDEYLSRKIFDA